MAIQKYKGHLALLGAAVTLAEEQYKQESFFVERAALDRAHAA